MRRYVEFILRFRWWVVALILIITAGAGGILTRAVISTDLARMFLGEDPGYYRFKEKIGEFGSDYYIAYALRLPKLFSKASSQRIEALSERIEGHPEVESVSSLYRAPYMVDDGERLKVSTYGKAIQEGASPETLKAALAGDEAISSTMISRDGEYLLLIVKLVFDETRTAENGPKILADVEAMMTADGFLAEETHRAGMLASIYGVIQQTVFSINRVLPVVIIVLLLSVWLAFRRLWPVLVTMLVGGIAATWTMALSVLIDPRISVLMAMVPAVVLTVSFSDVIHLCSAYLMELRRGSDKQEAIVKSGSEVGLACLWTSATTFVGFIALSFIPTPVFRQLGIVLASGVGVALLLAMTLGPVAFSFLKRPPAWDKGSARRVQSVIDGFLNWVEAFVLARPVTVVLVFVGFLGLSIWGASAIYIDVDFQGRLSKEDPIRVDQEWFQSHFPGTGTISIFVDTGKDEGIKDPATLQALAAYEGRVESLPDVDGLDGLPDLVRRVYGTWRKDDPDRLPDTSEAMAQTLLMLEGTDGLDQFVDFEGRHLMLLLRLPEKGVREMHEVGALADRLAAPLRELGMEVEVSGTAYLVGGWLDHIVDGQRNGLLIALAMVALMMMFALRSVRAGLVSMVPNVLPLLALGALAAVLWDLVDSDTLGIAMMAIGIGVDDTIHFLMRFRLECRRGLGERAAMRETLRFSGRAIIITSLVLGAGFAPFALSSYVPVRNMGTLLPFCFLVAVVADLFMVPALAVLGAFPFSRKGNRGYQAAGPETAEAPADPALKILLVNPHDATYRYDASAFKKNVTYYALTLPTLASLVPKELNASVMIVDEGIEPLTGLAQADLVAITAVTPSAPRAYEIAAEARAMGKTVVMGGPHATLVPDEVAVHADAVVTGFAEESWPRLLREFAATGKLAPRYQQEPKRPLVNLPIPRRDMLQLGKYLRIPVLQASRGCPNRCTFCCIPAMWGQDFHRRPVADVVHEVKAIGSRRLLFLDPSMAEQRAYGLELFAALRPLKVRWGGLATVKMAFDDELLQAAARSGCRGLLVGFESICQASLDGIHKSFGNAKEYKEAVRRFHAAGIAILGTFVFGLDHETPDVFEQTAQFIDEAQIDLVRYSVFTPFPGTQAFADLDAQGRILTRDWGLYNTENVVFQPQNFTPEELQQGLARAWAHTYSYASILRRVRPASKLSWLTLGANLAFRHYARKAVPR
jgi:predicted RND superfamily exporter protein/radical SAM superfamily enzyme YgiQ (UPF0313 family)